MGRDVGAGDVLVDVDAILRAPDRRGAEAGAAAASSALAGGLVGCPCGEAGLLGLGFLDVSAAGTRDLGAPTGSVMPRRAASAKPDDLVCASTYAVAADPSEAGETGLAANGGGGRTSRDWLEELSAIGIDHVVLRAGPLEGGHEETCRRIRWFAGS